MSPIRQLALSALIAVTGVLAIVAAHDHLMNEQPDAYHATGCIYTCY